jgi:ParB family chromosome partitioning protein
LGAVAEQSPAVAPGQQPGAKPEGIKAPEAGAKTSPGALMGFMAKESAALQENETLKKELAEWDGAVPARPLDPQLVVASPWANRVEESFSGPEFAALKEEIGAAGRNVQPIKVRPLPGSEPQKYEIVFGHRRHRACLELGLPVWALIESLDDGATFVEMERENRERENLSPYEQGLMYQRGVKLFGGLRKLADRIHRDPGNMSKAIQIAELPDVVLRAFPSRNDIQFRWAKALADQHRVAPAELERRARQLAADRAKGVSRSAAQVFQMLVPAPDAARPVEKRLMAGDKLVGTIHRAAGKLTITFEKDAFGPARISELERLLEDFAKGVVPYNS